MTPGFTAEAAVGRTSNGIQTGPAHGVRGVRGRRGVSAQLKGGGFRGRLGGGLGTLGDYWTCKDACYKAWGVCLMGCEGTWGSPKGSSNCILCDQDYRACVNRCAGDIA